MTIDLDNLDEIKEIDSGNVLGSVESLPDQCLDAWNQTSTIDVPDEYRSAGNIVMCGMGGSGLGARVIESLYLKHLTIPLIRVNDYDLPNFVNNNSLVICSSYSGSTEETLSNANQAIIKGAKWMAIGKGGELIEMAKEHNVTYYQINSTHNPSNQPRMAIGYSVVGLLALLSKTGLISISKDEIDEIVLTMNEIKLKSGVDVRTSENTAKQLAIKMLKKDIFYVSAGHLVGAMHTVNNQLNENAKAISADFTIPELNHHLMEGLKNPQSNNSSLFIIFVDSTLYSDRIRKRFRITSDVVSKNNIANYTLVLNSKSELTQTFELIQFGAYVNFYLSMLYGVNPAPIPWVDYFKEQMKD